MNHKKRRLTFRPSVSDGILENRLVLSTSVATPPPAAAPVYSPVVITSAEPWRNARQLRAAYVHQAELATVELRSMVGSEIREAYSSSSTLTSQQKSNLQASVQGALDATALRLSSQASLLPGSGTRLVPAIQNAILGTGRGSLSSKLNALLGSSRDTASQTRLESLVARTIINSPSQVVSNLNRYFATPALTQQAVNSSGQQIPFTQYMSQQVVSQLGNSLGTLAQSFPTVANAMLSASGTTSTPSQQLMSAFDQQVSNAITTAAYQLGDDLALFPQSTSVVSQLEPLLLGSGTSSTSLVSALQNLEYGGTGFNTAVTNAFNTGFGNLVGPLSTFLGTQSQTGLTLPTSGYTNPFAAVFTGPSFNSGFNNGFATGTNPGYIGFGVAPTQFNTSYGSGFNNMVSFANQGLGYVTSLLGSTGTGTTLGTTGTGSTGIGTGTGTGTGLTGTGTGTTGSSGGTVI